MNKRQNDIQHSNIFMAVAQGGHSTFNDLLETLLVNGSNQIKVTLIILKKKKKSYHNISGQKKALAKKPKQDQFIMTLDR